MGATCKEFRALIVSSGPYRRICTEEFGIPEEPGNNWYQIHHEATTVQGDSSPLAMRTATMFSRLKGFLHKNGLDGILQSLNPAATPQQIEEVERTLGLELPKQMRLLYQLFDGQSTDIDALIDAQRDHGLDPSIWQGILGGYSFYDHIVATRLYPLARVLRYTRMCRDNRIISGDSTRIIFAASFNFSKLFFFDAMTGQVHVSLTDKRQTLPAGPEGDDGMLRWFEEYTRRVTEEGMYEVDRIVPELPSSRGINLFPQTAPLQSTATTRGIIVKASAIFIPEQSVLRGLTPRYQFAYSVRYNLQPLEEQAADPRNAGVVTRSAQLSTRHWLIRDDKGIVTGEVRGEGVIGEFPIVKPDSPDFVYQSCTHQGTRKGSMEGDFGFVLGTIDQPAGGQAQVDATCGRFPLDVPDFIY